MSFDKHKNLAISVVAVAPSPASSGLALTLVAGGGALMPEGVFDGLVWPAGAQPSLANAEIVRVESTSGDHIALSARAQGGTSARAIQVGDQFANAITVKAFTDLEGAIEVAKGEVATEKARAEAAEALKAPLASPALTGTPTAPTAAPLTDNTQVSTTGYADAAVGVERTRAEGAEATEKTRAQAAEALLAPLASPALTGTPTAPTQAEGDNSTKLATTAFAHEVASTAQAAAQAASIPLSQKGAASGVATLDGEGHVPSGQLTKSAIANAASIDLCRTHGVVPGNDITTPLQEAINALAENGYGGTIYCSIAGAYNINGPVLTGEAHGYQYAGQILLPAVGIEQTKTAPAPVIILEGLNTMRAGGSNGAPAGGWQIVSNAASGYAFDCIPAFTQYGALNPWTLVSLIARDLVLTLPENPQCGGFNMRTTFQSCPERLLVQAANWTGEPLALTGTLEGWVDPQTFNSDPHSRDLFARGLPIAARLSEHGQLKLRANYCRYVIAAQSGGHPIDVVIDAENNGAIFLFDPKSGGLEGTELHISGTLDMENAGTTDTIPVMFAEGHGTIGGRLAVNFNQTTGAGTLGLAVGVDATGLDVGDLALTSGKNNGDLSGWRAKHPEDTFARLNKVAQEAGAPGQSFPTLHPWRQVGINGGFLAEGVTFPAASFKVRSGTYRSKGSVYVPGAGLITYKKLTGTTFEECTGGSGTVPAGTPVDPVLFKASGAGKMFAVNGGGSINQAAIPAKSAVGGALPRRITVNGKLGSVISGAGAYGTGIFAQRVYNTNECIWAALYSNGTTGEANLQFGIGEVKNPLTPKSTVEKVAGLKAESEFTLSLEVLYRESKPAQVNVYVNGTKQITYTLTEADQKALEQAVIPSHPTQSFEDGFWFAPEDTTTALGSTGAMGTGFRVADAAAPATVEVNTSEVISGYQNLLVPVFQGERYVPTSTVGMGTALKWTFHRAVVRKAGTLKALYCANGTVAGEIRAAILDCGAATAGEYTVLWEGAALAMSGANAWQLLGEPNLVVTPGQELMLAFAASSTSATFGNLSGSGASGFGQLPQVPKGATSAVLPKMIPGHTTASLTLGGAGTKLTETTLVNSGVPIVLLGFVE